MLLFLSKFKWMSVGLVFIILLGSRGTIAFIAQIVFMFQLFKKVTYNTNQRCYVVISIRKFSDNSVWTTFMTVIPWWITIFQEFISLFRIAFFMPIPSFLEFSPVLSKRVFVVNQISIMFYYGAFFSLFKILSAWIVIMNWLKEYFRNTIFEQGVSDEVKTCTVM